MNPQQNYNIDGNNINSQLNQVNPSSLNPNNDPNQQYNQFNPQQGMIPNPQPNPSMGMGLNTGMGMGLGMNPGLNPGMGQGLNPGMNPGMGQGLNPGMNPGMGQGLNPGMNSGMNPGMGQGLNPGMNPGMGQGMNPGMNPGLGQGMGQGLNPDLGQGMNPGMGMGMNPNMYQNPQMGTQMGPTLQGEAAGGIPQSTECYKEGNSFREFLTAPFILCSNFFIIISRDVAVKEVYKMGLIHSLIGFGISLLKGRPEVALCMVIGYVIFIALYYYVVPSTENMEAIHDTFKSFKVLQAVNIMKWLQDKFSFMFGKSEDEDDDEDDTENEDGYELGDDEEDMYDDQDISQGLQQPNLQPSLNPQQPVNIPQPPFGMSIPQSEMFRPSGSVLGSTIKTQDNDFEGEEE